MTKEEWYKPCEVCDGDGLIEFTDEEWDEIYSNGGPEKGHPTMKRCSSCNGTGERK